MTRHEMSLVAINALDRPGYCPHCLRCLKGRMTIIENFYWGCPCGARHDERKNVAANEAATLAQLEGRRVGWRPTAAAHAAKCGCRAPIGASGPLASPDAALADARSKNWALGEVYFFDWDDPPHWLAIPKP